MRLFLIACEVLLRELEYAVSVSPHTVETRRMPKALHDRAGATMRDGLQAVVDEVDGGDWDAIVLGYALCGNGLAGLTARSKPLVVARAHDCITLLLGSRARYKEFFEQNSGTYFRSTGWVEYGGDMEQMQGLALSGLIAKYGEENGRYLYEEMTRYRAHYSRLVFIENGLEPDSSFAERARAEAELKGWNFDKTPGELGLFERLLAGQWEGGDFLVVQPGERIAPSWDDEVVKAERSR